jgi:hypothetical protein
MISNEALPDPTIIPALIDVSGMQLVERIFSTFFLDARCLDSFFSFAIQHLLADVGSTRFINCLQIFLPATKILR